MCYVKQPVKVLVGGAGSANIMRFWTMEGYDVVLLKWVAAFVVRIKIGGDEGAGSVLSGGSFDSYWVGNLEYGIEEF